MPKLTSFALVFCAVMTLFSCATYRQQVFYSSPFNGNSENYHALPMHSDTVRTAVYGRISGFGGYANGMENDHYGGGNASMYIAHHGNWWQGYYGADVTLGGYTAGRWSTQTRPQNFGPWPLRWPDLYLYDRVYEAPAHAQQLNTYNGAYSYGGLGFSGGFNAVKSMGQGEWRFLGVETALHQEFGQYRQFRGKLPDTLASYLVRHPFYGTAGLTSEFIFRTRTGDFGFRLAHGWVFGREYEHTGVYDSGAVQQLFYGYTGFTAHVTMGRYTVYYQGEVNSTGDSYQVGIIYRFGRPRAPAKKKVYHERPPAPPPPPRPRFPWSKP